MNILDIIFIIIVVLSIMFGYYRGFLNRLIRVISIIINIILLGVLYSPIKQFFLDSRLFLTIQNFFSGSINIENIVKSTQGDILNYVNSAPFPDIIKSLITQNYNEQALTFTASEYITNALANIVISALSIICVFIIVSIITTIISSFVRLLLKIAPLKSFDKLCGSVLGAICGYFSIYILSLLIICLSLNPSFNELVPIFESSKIATLISQTTFFNYIMDTFIII